jgi:probable HAF family extracellular repeat protein
MVDLGTLGGSNSLALAINNSGQAVCWSLTSSGVTHAFLYANGEMKDLGVPPGAGSSTAIAISSNGEILGEIQVGSDTEISRYSNGAWTELGTGVNGTVNTLAAGINSSGEIVGSGTFPGVYSPRNARKPAVPIGFIYLGGAFVDLNTLIPSNSEFHIAAALAIAIKDAGAILCNATNSNGQMAALLTPR